TPWAWVALLGGLLLAAALTAGWALGRRRESRRNWRALAARAGAEGMTIHDMALTTAVGSASANQPAEWTDSAARAGALADELRRIEHSAPTTDDARTAATAAVAVDDVGSAMEVASAAPEGVPLDDHMAQMLLARLDEMSAALAPLREGDVG
ncbi:MAG: hypothetical protein ACHQEA_10975, partial [Gaiellales bacterium]